MGSETEERRRGERVYVGFRYGLVIDEQRGNDDHDDDHDHHHHHDPMRQPRIHGLRAEFGRPKGERPAEGADLDDNRELKELSGILAEVSRKAPLPTENPKKKKTKHKTKTKTLTEKTE